MKRTKATWLWFWLLFAVSLWGWSHWRDVEKQRARQQYQTRLDDIEIHIARAQNALATYKKDSAQLENKESPPRAAGYLKESVTFVVKGQKSWAAKGCW